MFKLPWIWGDCMHAWSHTLMRMQWNRRPPRTHTLAFCLSLSYAQTHANTKSHTKKRNWSCFLELCDYKLLLMCGVLPRVCCTVCTERTTQSYSPAKHVFIELEGSGHVSMEIRKWLPLKFYVAIYQLFCRHGTWTFLEFAERNVCPLVVRARAADEVVDLHFFFPHSLPRENKFKLQTRGSKACPPAEPETMKHSWCTFAKECVFTQ